MSLRIISNASFHVKILQDIVFVGYLVSWHQSSTWTVVPMLLMSAREKYRNGEDLDVVKCKVPFSKSSL